MQILRPSSVGSKFTKFIMSFFKAQVSSSSNFVSFFSVMTQCYNSSVLFGSNIYTFDKSSTSKFKFSDLKFTKFLMSFLEPRFSFSSNFASLLSVMRDNSSALFWLKLYMVWTKGTCPSAKFQTFDCLRKISPNLYFDKFLLFKVYEISAKKI